MTHHCHVGDSADSMGSGANPEESSFFKGGIYFFFFTGAKPKSALYYRGQKPY